MPKVLVSAARFASLLSNRNLTPMDVVERSTATDRVIELVDRDLEVELADVLALAKFFNRPWSYLLIDQPEQFPGPGSDNRTFWNRKIQPSPAILAELQAADLMLESSAEFFEMSAFRVPSVQSAGLVEPMALNKLAAQIRALLGVGLEGQLSARDDYAALRLWVSAIHSTGVYVSQRSLRDKSVRAFSKIITNQAVIVVDTADAAPARIFSVLHEYCHVIMRSTGICDLDDHGEIERKCNAIAARVLLPDELLDRTITSLTFTGDEESQDDLLRSFSKQFHVSQAALLIRLRDHEIISREAHEAMEARRSSRRPEKRRPGGQYYASAINRVGRLYAGRVAKAITGGVIDRQDASVLLGVGEHSIPRYLVELAKGDEA